MGMIFGESKFFFLNFLKFLEKFFIVWKIHAVNAIVTNPLLRTKMSSLKPTTTKKIFSLSYHIKTPFYSASPLLSVKKKDGIWGFHSFPADGTAYLFVACG